MGKNKKQIGSRNVTADGTLTLEGNGVYATSTGVYIPTCSLGRVTTDVNGNIIYIEDTQRLLNLEEIKNECGIDLLQFGDNWEKVLNKILKTSDAKKVLATCKTLYGTKNED